MNIEQEKIQRKRRRRRNLWFFNQKKKLKNKNKRFIGTNLKFSRIGTNETIDTFMKHTIKKILYKIYLR